MPASALQPLVRLLRRTHRPTGDADLLRGYVADRDADAFAELVARHGPLVRGTCRRILGDRHAAEDAFQATFVALARQARSIRHPEALPAWLHGVALRTACQARGAQVRRRHHEAKVTTPLPVDPLAEITGRELVAVIDEELARLPESYRLPLLLCGLDGLARDEAATRLGWTLGTLRGRLERGREMLRNRLTARGLEVPAVLAAGLLAGSVPAELVAATTRAALAVPFAATASVKVAVWAAVFVAAVGGGGAVALVEAGVRNTQVAPVAHAPRLPDDPPMVIEPKPRVDAEGVPLPPGVLARIGSSRMRHGGSVSSMVVASDGQTLASAGGDGFRVWDTATGKLVCFVPNATTFLRHSIGFAASSHDLLCVTSPPDNTTFLRVDATTGRERLRIELKDAVIVGFARSGRRLVYSHRDKSVRICDATTGRELLRIPDLSPLVRGLAFSPDDRALAIADLTDTISLFDTTTGAKTGEIKHESLKIGFVAIAPDGRTIAGQDSDEREPRHEVHLWDLETRKYHGQLQGNDSTKAYHFQFSRDGKTLVTAGPWTEPILWDAGTRTEIRRFPGVAGTICTAFSPDGKTLFGGTNGGTIALWDIESGRLRPASANPVIGVRGIRYVGGGGRLIAQADRVMVWDAATGREVARYPFVPVAIGVTTLSPDGRLLAGIDDGGVMRVWDAATGQEIRKMSGERMISQTPVFTPDGRRLMGADLEKRILVWDVGTGRILATLTGSTGFVYEFAVSPDARRLASVSRAGDTIRVWDLTTYKEIQHFQARRGIMFRVVFGPDGRRLVSTGGVQDLQTPSNYAGEVELWEVETGRPLRSFEGHTQIVTCAAFAPDCRTLATGGVDATIRLWEVRTGAERHRFTGHASMVESLAFAPDGRTLAAASSDAPVYIWDVIGRLEFAGRAMSAADLDQAWAALAGQDAKAAFQAIRRLVNAPEQALPFLKARLTPATAVDAKQVTDLIRQLDSPRFAERQKATADLEKLGDRAAAELRAGLQAATSAEVRTALQRLLDRIAAGTPETLRAIRAVEVLEYLASPAAREQLKLLSVGAPGADLTKAAGVALKRMDK